jgi:predicted RecB family endonuclease
MPKQNRASWRSKRRTRVNIAPSPSRTIEELPENMGETITAIYSDGWTSTVPVEMKPVVVGELAQMAALVWQNDYRLLFELEAEKLESSLGLVSSAMTLKEAVPQSTYARELQAKGKQPKRAHREPDQAADLARAAYRQANQRHHTFKTCVRTFLGNVGDTNSIF